LPIPAFIDNYHLPDGEHECTIQEIEQVFLFSEKRHVVWNYFKNMIDRLTQLGIKPEYVYINGSFVTGREEPGDVDFAALIKPGPMARALKNADEHDKQAIQRFFDPQHAEVIRDLMGGHLLIARDNATMRQWSDFFRKGKGGSLREPDPNRDPSWVVKPRSKGILKVVL